MAVLVLAGDVGSPFFRAGHVVQPVAFACDNGVLGNDEIAITLASSSVQSVNNAKAAIAQLAASACNAAVASGQIQGGPFSAADFTVTITFNFQ
jgi:hypothetical protein